MTKLQRYLAEEIAIDHADGFISRREALRRLALLGLALPPATALLAACASNEDAQVPLPPATTGGSTTSSPTTTAPVATREITFAGPAGRRVRGAWAPAAAPRGGVLVIHENRGLTDHIRSVAGRFAGDGYSALAIDLPSEEGGTGSFSDSAG